jgi:hypothetical protein
MRQSDPQQDQPTHPGSHPPSYRNCTAGTGAWKGKIEGKCEMTDRNAEIEQGKGKILEKAPEMIFSRDQLIQIDKWIAATDLTLDRPEAIRRLVELGLKSPTSIPKKGRSNTTIKDSDGKIISTKP